MIIKDNHEAIIDRATFEKAQVLLEERSKIQSKTGKEHTCILSGRAKCGKCGATLQGHRQKHSNGEIVPYMICSTKKKNPGACEGTRIREDKLCRLVSKAIQETLMGGMTIKQIASRLDKLEGGDTITLGVTKKKLSVIKEIIRPDVTSPKVNKPQLNVEIAAIKQANEKATRNLMGIDDEEIRNDIVAMIRSNKDRITTLQAIVDSTEVTEQEIDVAAYETMKSLMRLIGRLVLGPQRAERTKVAGKLLGNGEVEQQRLVSALEKVVVHTSLGSGKANGGKRNKPKSVELVLRKVGDTRVKE